VREGLGLTQEEFAWRFGLDLAALRNWEQGRTRPETAVRSFLQVIARDPRAVERALG
jgi:putative transcriptional regulator